MSLFRLGEFKLHSGAASPFKIDCDALTAADWEALAALAAPLVGPFGTVMGVPRGGLPFAAALSEYADHPGPLLVCDDVLTTGASMERIRAAWLDAGFRGEVKGVVAFARGPVPEWVTALWTLAGCER